MEKRSEHLCCVVCDSIAGKTYLTQHFQKREGGETWGETKVIFLNKSGGAETRKWPQEESLRKKKNSRGREDSRKRSEKGAVKQDC